MVQKYCDQYKIGEYTDLALALMMQESGGAEPDPMQAAEGSYGLYCIQTKIIMVDTAIVQEEFQKDMENVQLTLEFRN